MSLFKKLFLAKEIKSKKGYLHFKRWRILETKWFNIYIHRIYRSDQDQHCHDHPWSFVNLILWGSYAVARPFDKDGQSILDYEWRSSPGLFFNRSKDFHKIEYIPRPPVTTLVITGPRKRNWGYWVDGKWMEHAEYRTKKNAGELYNI